MENIKDSLLRKREKFAKPDKNVSQEFQMYGYELAKDLNDLKHKSLYIKLAKDLPRDMLNKAYSFTKDYTKAKSKAKVFMFKLKELKDKWVKSR